MNSYIVRIYRREKDSFTGMFGVVTCVDESVEQPFISAEELWQILGKQKSGEKERMLKSGQVNEKNDSTN